MRRADRLFQIVQRLRARRLTTAAQLATSLGVSERTIYRDVRDLSLSGVPVRGEAGVGYSLDRSFDLTALMFTPEEVEAVVVGLRLVRAYGGPKLAAAAAPAVDKIVLALPKDRREEVERPRMYAPTRNAQRAVEGVIETMRAAIENHAVIEMSYSDGGGASTQRRVRPLGLHFWGSAWTLAAWCELRRDFRSFRLDRIGTYAVTGDTFRDEPGKTLDDYLRKIGAK